MVQKRSAIVTGNTLLIRTCKVVTTFPIYSEAFRFNKSSTASSHIFMLLVIVQHTFDIFKTRLFVKDATPKKTEKKNYRKDYIPLSQITLSESPRNVTL